MATQTHTPTGTTSDRTHMVVVGTITTRTPTHVGLRYESISGPIDVSITRTDLTIGGSVGVPLSDNLRAIAFKACSCPRCNNNNALLDEALSTNPSLTLDEIKSYNPKHYTHMETDDDGNKTRTEVKCIDCNGKGQITAFNGNNSPMIDAEHSDVTEGMAQGILPEANRPQFRSTGNGGRGGSIDDWDVVMDFKEHQVMNTLGDHVGTGTYQVYNPAYANESNGFVGMPIGPTRSHVYCFKQHNEVIPQFMAQFDAMDIPYTVWATNFGQDAFIDVTIAENGSKEEVINSLKAMRADQPELWEELGGLSNKTLGVVKMGLRIHHSFDGALKISTIAERVWCLNGCVSNAGEVLASVQHKIGTWNALGLNGAGSNGWTVFTQAACAMAVDMFKQMNRVESMNDIDLAPEDFEAIVELARRRGIIDLPNLGKDGQLTGGKDFRNISRGWANPSEEWVAVGVVDGVDTGSKPHSLYHAYQAIQGAKDHSPVVRDAHGTVTGGKATGYARTNAQIHDTHLLLMEVLEDAEKAWKASGSDEDINTFVHNNGIPMLLDCITPALPADHEGDNIVRSEGSAGTERNPLKGAYLYTWEEGQILPTINKDIGLETEQSVPLTLAYRPA